MYFKFGKLGRAGVKATNCFDAVGLWRANQHHALRFDGIAQHARWQR